MKKAVFTLCSNNYLAYAYSLLDSIKQFNEDFDLFIGLVDVKNDSIDYRFPVIPVEEIAIIPLKELINKYHIIELNTSVKPFYFEYLFKNYDAVIYLDPDIQVFTDLNSVIDEAAENDCLLTPHFLTSVDDGKQPDDFQMIVTGIYNLGFLYLRNSENSRNILKWWQKKVVNFGFSQPDNHMFYDQLWMNLVPVFFQGVKVSKHPGLNISSWNLHERELKESHSGYEVIFKGEVYPVVFYHFAEYKIDKPDIIADFNSRFTLKSRPDVQKIFNSYLKALIQNNYEKYKSIPIGFIVQSLGRLRANPDFLFADVVNNHLTLTNIYFEKNGVYDYLNGITKHLHISEKWTNFSIDIDVNTSEKISGISIMPFWKNNGLVELNDIVIIDENNQESHMNTYNITGTFVNKSDNVYEFLTNHGSLTIPVQKTGWKKIVIQGRWRVFGTWEAHQRLVGMTGNKKYIFNSIYGKIKNKIRKYLW